MTVSQAAARDLSLRIRSLHETKSYRCIAREDFPGVAAGTLNRIAKEGGRWMPHDKSILRALGVLVERKHADEHTKFVRRKIRKMAKDTQHEIDEATHQTLS